MSSFHFSFFLMPFCSFLISFCIAPMPEDAHLSIGTQWNVCSNMPFFFFSLLRLLTAFFAFPTLSLNTPSTSDFRNLAFCFTAFKAFSIASLALPAWLESCVTRRFASTILIEQIMIGSIKNFALAYLTSIKQQLKLRLIVVKLNKFEVLTTNEGSFPFRKVYISY